MKQITNYMGIAVSPTTGIVDKLVKKNYLLRQYSEEDRCSISIILNEEGIKCHNMMCRMREDMANRILDGLSPKDSDCFIDLLEKVTINLNQYVPTV